MRTKTFCNYHSKTYDDQIIVALSTKNTHNDILLLMKDYTKLISKEKRSYVIQTISARYRRKECPFNSIFYNKTTRSI